MALCPDCGSYIKRSRLMDGRKICIDCYEEYAASAWIKNRKETV